MARDWNFLRLALPGLKEDPTYDDVLRHVRDGFRGKPLTELADRLEQLEDSKLPLEREIAGIDAQIAAIESVAIERLKELDLESVRTSSGGTFRIDDQIDAVKTDNAALLKWIEAHGMTEVLSVHGQTLSAMVRRRVESGEEIPDGVEVKPRGKLQFRRGRR